MRQYLLSLVARQTVGEQSALFLQSMVKRNLIANYLGQAWVVLMGFAFTPLHIKYIGIESYGLIGLFTVLQTWLFLLDLGMTPALGRELARFTGGAHSSVAIRDLLRSVEWIAGTIGLLVTIGIWTASGWMASDWLQTEKLPEEIVDNSLVIMGGVIGLRFVESVYRSSLIGLQRQTIFNFANAALATMRSVGALGVLAWLSPTIEAFFIWQGIISFLTLTIFAAMTYRIIPCGDRSGRFSLSALLSVRKFAGGMVALSTLTLILTGVDKILLSGLLTLTEYASYMLALTVASAMPMMVTPVVSAVYPRMCELVELKDKAKLIIIFHRSTQIITVVMGATAMVIVQFSETLLLLWTHDLEIAERTADLLSLLVLVQLVSGLMYIAHYAQLAHGWITLELRIYSIATALIVPLLLWVTPVYGAIGAAGVLLALGIGQLIIGLSYMFRRIMVGEKFNWYVQDMAIPLAAALGFTGITRAYITMPQDYLAQLLLMVGILVCTLLAGVITASHTRKILQEYCGELKAFICKTRI